MSQPPGPYGSPPPPGNQNRPPWPAQGYPPAGTPVAYPAHHAPGGQGYGGAPPPAPGGKRRRWWIPALIVGLVVILVGGGAGTAWWLTSSTTPPERPLKGRIAWKTAPAGEKRSIIGSWSSEQVVAQLNTGKLAAFTTTTGRPAWTITPEQLPGLPSAGVFCDSSRVVHGLGVVSFGVLDAPNPVYDESCYGLALIDVATGAIKWTAMLPRTDDIDLPVDNELPVDIAGDAVVYAHLDHYAAVSLASGQPAWSYDDPACRPWDHEGSRKIVVTSLSCDDDVTRMTRLRAADGSVASTTEVNSAPSEVVTADPPVLLTSNGSVANPQFGYAVFDRHGRKQATIPDSSPVGELEVGAVDYGGIGVAHHKDYPVVVANGMLIVPTHPRRSPVSSVRFTNHVVAYELDTGRMAWSRQLAKDYATFPLGVSKQGVIAITSGTVDDPTRVVRLSWRNGTPTPLSKPYNSREARSMATMRSLYWDGRRVYGINMVGPQAGPVALALS